VLPLTTAIRYRVHEAGDERGGVIAPGQLWQCPQHIPYEIWSEKSGSMLWWSLLPDATLAPLTTARLLRPRPLTARIPVLYGWILEDHVHQNHVSAARMLHEQAELLAICIRRVSSDDRDPRLVGDRRSLRPLWQAVIRNPELRWTLADLAGRCGMDRFRLIRVMRSTYGCTPMAMVGQLRLQRTQELLAEGEATLAAIAAEVGYSSGFALSKAFRRMTGMTPADFRRRSRMTSSGKR
jgi:AraC-like DNA-binding protein